ncbi:acyltransferase family protein [Enterobacter cloacae]|uniref:acyltransferase family protein n=1 Tax=Enterobacter cloacae TaxID=550 RepID=UPI000D37832D|nr:acyltransferase [Enterobacter cloacae]
MQPNTKIHGIQYLRGLAAFLVVLLHSAWLIGPEWKSFLRHASIGVDIFFIISGFIIYTVTENKSEAQPRTFLMKRLFRIYPVFVFALIVAVLYTDARFISLETIRSLFLFHVDYTTFAPMFKLNTVVAAWTLTYEIYFYIIFMFAFMISHKYRGMIAGVSLILLPVILQLSFNGNFSLDVNSSAKITSNLVLYAPVAVLSCTIVWEFVVGIVFGYLWKRFAKDVMACNSSLVAVTSAILLIAFICLTFGGLQLSQGVTGFLFPAACIFVSFLIIGNKLNFTIKTLEFMGDISYSMYMTHTACNFILGAHIHNWWRDIPKPYNLFFYLVLMFALSTIVHYAIEKPAIKLCRKLLQSTPKKIHQSTSAKA